MRPASFSPDKQENWLSDSYSMLTSVKEKNQSFLFKSANHFQSAPLEEAFAPVICNWSTVAPVIAGKLTNQ